MGTLALSDEEIREYLEELATIFGLDHLIDELKEDSLYSDNIKIHLDILEHSLDAPTIVFIPGTATYAMCYGQLLSQVHCAGYNVIGFDPRGHGRSGGDRGDYTVGEIIKDAQAVITYAIENYNEEVSIMGCSQGGISALYLAAADDRVKSAVCQNFADLTDPEIYRLSRFPNLTRLLKPSLLAFAGILPNISIPIKSYLDFKEIKLKHFGNVKNFIETDPLALKAIKIRAIKSLATTKLARPLEEIEVPVFVLQPGADEIFPVDYTQKIHDRLNCKKRMEVYEGMSHAMMVENVEVFIDDVVEWLKEIHPER